MCERIENIKRFYDDLKYDENEKKNALIEIANLIKECDISNNGNDDYLKRFIDTISVIERNLSLFQLACEHVDVVTTILEYLNNFVMKSTFGKFSQLEVEEEEVTSIMYTLSNVCRQYEVQSFLENSIVKNSTLNMEFFFRRKLGNQLPNEIHEMIILEDSDIHAVIDHLMIIRNISLNKIWIQEPIKEKFLLLIKKFGDLNCIQVFRSKQELFTSSAIDKMNILSIWTEDVIAAKNLATGLDRNVVFINTHMDLCGGIVLLPYNIQALDKTLLEYFQLQNKIVNSKPVIEPTNNLFYDGMWQKPAKTAFWKYNDNSWITGTRNDDIKRCIESAKKGVKIWSNWSHNARIQALSKFAYTLKCNGKLELADIVLKWLKFPYFCEHSLFYSQNGRLEITTIRKPRGIIIIKEEAEDSLCRHLVQALMTGNCVIIISSGKMCTLTSYCDMFSTSKIPAGVINLLTSEKIEDILNVSLYDDYAKKLFLGEQSDVYTNLTTYKKIVLPVK